MDTWRTYITKAEDLKTKEMDGKRVLLDLDSGRYFTLNEVGNFIWTLLDGKTPSARIVEAVTAAYNVDAEGALADVVDLIRRLSEEGLIRLHDAPQSD